MSDAHIVHPHGAVGCRRAGQRLVSLVIPSPTTLLSAENPAIIGALRRRRGNRAPQHARAGRVIDVAAIRLRIRGSAGDVTIKVRTKTIIRYMATSCIALEIDRISTTAENVVSDINVACGKWARSRA